MYWDENPLTFTTPARLYIQLAVTTHFLVIFFASGNDDDINDVACMAGVNLQVRRGKSRSTLYQEVVDFFCGIPLR
jgi:hypothetical protein